MRHLHTLAGLGLLAAATHASIMASGGYAGSRWVLPTAIAAGIAAGAAMIGGAWRERRYGLAIMAAVALICAEAYGLISTGENIVASREAAAIPYREQIARHDAAKAAHAEAVAAVPATSERLTKAETALRDANAAVIAKAADKSCVANCRALLEQQVTAATDERDAARKQLEADQAAAVKAIAAALARLDAAPMPAPRAGLASEIGVSGTTLNLLHAALGALGINALASVLIAFGVHARAPSAAATPAQPTTATAPPAQETIAAAPMPAPSQLSLPAPRIVPPTIEAQQAAPMPPAQDVDAAKIVAQFAASRLTTGKRAAIEPLALWRAFEAWRSEAAAPAVSREAFVLAVAGHYRNRGVRLVDDRLVGLGLKQAA